MSNKRKLKEKIDRLKTALRKSQVEMKLMRSDFLIDLERLAYNLHFSEGNVRMFMRDNRILREQLAALTPENKNVPQDAQGVENPDTANYTCVICKDTGVSGEVYCTCLAGRTLLQNERREPEKVNA